MELEKFLGKIEDDKYFKGIDTKPFDATKDMVGLTYHLIKDIKLDTCDSLNLARSKFSRSQKIFNWVYTHIKPEFNPKCLNDPTDLDRLKYYRKSASETFALRRGMCMDASFLYTTMAKIAGLESGIAIIYKNSSGREEDHVCSWVEWLDKIHLMDTSRANGFGISHKTFIL